MATKTTFGGAVYLSFGDEVIALSTKDLKSINFAYHADSFVEALTLGTPEQAVEAILAKFTGETTTWDVIKAKLTDFETLPIIGDIVKRLMEADVVITDFVINQPDGVYEFGIGLRFTTNPPTIGPVSLGGFAVKVTMLIPPKPAEIKS